MHIFNSLGSCIHSFALCYTHTAVHIHTSSKNFKCNIVCKLLSRVTPKVRTRLKCYIIELCVQYKMICGVYLYFQFNQRTWKSTIFNETFFCRTPWMKHFAMENPRFKTVWSFIYDKCNVVNNTGVVISEGMESQQQQWLRQDQNTNNISLKLISTLATSFLDYAFFTDHVRCARKGNVFSVHLSASCPGHPV